MLGDGTITPEIGTSGTFTRSSSETFADGYTHNDLDYVTTGNPAEGAAPYNGSGTALGVQFCGEIKNYILQSSHPATTWTQVGSPTLVQDSAAAGPDSVALSAGIVVGNSGDGIEQDAGVAAASKDWVFSAYVRAFSSTVDGLMILEGIGGTPETESEAFTVGTEWERVSVYKSFSGAATGNVKPEVLINEDGPVVLEVFGMQLERGYDGGVQGVNSKDPRCYVPTTTATVISAEDVLYYPLANFENKIETSGTIVAWIAPHRGYNRMVSANRSSVIFSINDLLNYFALNDTELEFRWGGNVVQRYTMSSYDANEWIHVAVAWEESGANFNIELFENGASLGTTSKATTAPTFSTNAYVGFRSSVAYDEYSFNGVIHDFRVFSEKLSVEDVLSIYDETKGIHGG